MSNDRQQAILQIIQEQDIYTQQELLQKLNQAGMSVTQATVSRDIQQMGLIKVRTDAQKNKYMLPQKYIFKNPMEKADTNSFGAVIREAVLEIDEAMNIVVIKCKEGFAGAACAAFDKMQFDGVVGTLAGDDTFFVLTRSKPQTQALIMQINNMIAR